MPDGLDTLQTALTEQLTALNAEYAELKRKQMALGIFLICGAIGMVGACIGLACWWEQHRSESTETPHEERNRRWKAVLGGSGVSPQAARNPEDPFAERQRQLQQQVRILPPDDDDDECDAMLTERSISQASSSSISSSGGGAASSVRQRKGGTAGAPTLRPRMSEESVADATTTARAGGPAGASTARDISDPNASGGWFTWLPFITGSPTGDSVTSQVQVKEAFARRQAHFRQQINILPADDSDEDD